MPPKLGIIRKSREVTDFWILRLPLPNINPDIISYLALPFSLAFVCCWDRYRLISFILFVLTLIIDWLDGLVAKKHNQVSEKGWVIDVVTDRLSEGIIFLRFFQPWFYFYVLNIFLTYLSYKFRKFSLILPLRQFFFLYLVIYYSAYYFLSP